MWIVVNIGCIDCGVTSAIVGVFSNECNAKEIASRLDDTHSWRQGGQNSFEVFVLPEPDVIDPEYHEGSEGQL